MPPCGVLMERCALKTDSSQSLSKQNRRPTGFSINKRDLTSQKLLTADLQALEHVSYNVDLAQQSGWYYGVCSSSEAKCLLQGQPVGTFIMRNSSDPKHLFTLSVRTERGPTSVRISYSEGLFQIDCEEHLKARMPRCENIIELVHTHLTLSKTSKFRDCRWLERTGKKDLVITLKRPRRNCVPTLAHLARLSVNSTLGTHLPTRPVSKLPIAKSVQRYLEEYPYVV